MTQHLGNTSHFGNSRQVVDEGALGECGTHRQGFALCRALMCDQVRARVVALGQLCGLVDWIDQR
jgi:hypothetical protein